MNSAVTPLFQPLSVRSLTLRNRIVMSAMTRSFSPGGVPGDDVATYYGRRAANEVGLILTEGVGVDDAAALDNPRIPVMHGEAALAGWRRVTERVHAAGGLIFPQLWHQGVLRDARIAANPALSNRSPSGISGPIGQTSLTPEFLETIRAPIAALTEEQVADLVAAFARSAGFAMEAGFDGIALHGGHGYLIDSFLWGGTNRRTDRYGGDHVGRTRFVVELVRAIRAVIGPDRPILLRFSQHKQQDYLARLAETPQQLGEILAPIADAGVDIFDASARRFWIPAFEGSDLNLAGWAKKLTGKIAMAVGSVGLGASLEESFASGEAKILDNIPMLMERFNRGDFDLVAVGRAILADPAWVRHLRDDGPRVAFEKAMLGRLE
ncbi:MAG TPA: NADH:flavin oxidoreductase [Alphaproteobacteria bacterium]|nr:NADH:flavin oxidoreductase [Alphaproteobacteria bacterium]